MNQTITIRIPEEMKKDLDELSKSEHKPVSDLVRESIRRYVAINRFRQLHNMVLPFAEAQGILTDEDVFDIMGTSKN
ncbi:MAG: CopG family transcriptional regulator [Spirochaetae bacterium HGW-Spirochaetae-1]|jgi:predicted transcriptional regulator|nr:MAG: CopG family transcriptional regulator [Spirochaetae bacterium HGW-Spirochaetae-1]